MTERPLRADARRNRDRLLAAAAELVTSEFSLDAIARRAGVGIGTLYRHFPTREALIEEVYRAELARLCDAVPALLAAEPPDRALRLWMDRFIDYMVAKHGMAEALNTVIAAGGTPFAHSRERLVGAAGALLRAGADAGTVRGDVDPADVLTALTGTCMAVGDPQRRDVAGRLLDLLMEGLRHRPSVT